jgi:hypothetical protein
METITLPFVIKWPAILAPFQAQYQREVQGYKDFLARVNNTPKPKTLEQELILISSVLGIAPVAFNVPLVIGGVRDAYYGSLFGFECLKVIADICCPVLAPLIQGLAVVRLVYKTRENVILALPKNKHLAEKVANLAISASQSTEALGNLDIALGQILRYKCPLSIESIVKIQEHDRVAFQYTAVVNETRRVQLFSFACRKENLGSYKEEIYAECMKIKQCFMSFGIEANITVQCALECTKKRTEATKEEIQKVKKEVLSSESCKRRKI